MSGHSRWTQIKHKKALTDQKRGQIFSKLIKVITIAARDGVNPETNSKLKAAIEKAKEFNLPNENIERAIKRASEKDKAQPETLLIEAVGPLNIIILIEAITDNKNRTVAEIKNILLEKKFKTAQPGSLLWQFEQKGVIRIAIPGEETPERHEHKPTRQSPTEEEFELQLIEAGAEEIFKEDGKTVIYTMPGDLFQIKSLLQERGFEIESAILEFIPKTPVKIEEEDMRRKLNELFEQLDEHDDVEEIYSNVIL